MMVRYGLVFFWCMCCVTPSAAQYSRVIVFGDSLSDVGNLDRATFGLRPGGDYYEGRFSNGPVYSELLTAKLGLGPLKPSSSGGTNFAYGGARTSGTSFLEGGLFIDDLDEQLEAFFEDRQVSATDLYVVFVGSNDFILGQATDPYVRANRVLTAVDQLLDAGAENVLSINLPLLGETPDGRADRTSLNARARDFNATLKAGLEEIDNQEIDNQDLNLFQLDLAELLSVVLEEPQAFQFSNTSSQGIAAHDATGYLFWDGNHPTTRAHALFAEAAYRLVQPFASVLGDFNLDGTLSRTDLDLMGRQVLLHGDRLSFDMNQDALLSGTDVDAWLLQANRSNGDADLNGQVGFEDFLHLSANFGRSDDGVRWSTGDFDVNGQVGFSDFLTLSGNFGTSAGLVVVPEPAVEMGICLTVLFLWMSGVRRGLRLETLSILKSASNFAS